MRVNLAYGRGRLPIDVPAEPTTVLEPTYIPGLPDQRQAVRDAISNPLASPALGDVVKAGQTVAISICDSTRPMPSRTVLPVVLEELSHTAGLEVVILIATGTHRATTDAELLEMVGEDVVNSYEVVNHDAFDRATLCQLPDAGSGFPV